MARYRVRKRSFVNGALVEGGRVVDVEHVGENDLWPKGHLEPFADEPAKEPDPGPLSEAPAAPESEPE